MHVPPRRSYTRIVGFAAVVLALAVTTGCSQGSSAYWRNAGDTQDIPSGEAGGQPKKAPGEFKITPAANATEVSVLDQATVTAQDATLDSVTITNPDGKQVAGDFSADHKSWQSSEHFGYGKEYTVVAKGTNSAGEPLELTSRFSTLKPKNQTLPYLRANGIHLLKERTTYGVGQPVVVWFDEKITDKAAAQKLLDVETSPHVDGAWSWISSQEAHWRPQAYWKPGTSVTVKANVYGKDLGGGVYGQSDVSASFKIGQSKIAIADYNTKMMQVYFDGQLIKTIPVSMGKGGTVKGSQGQTVNYWTNGGPHVVIGKTPTTRMTSSSYGITDPKDPNFYDEIIKLTVQISYSGEFVHLADWNVPLHGRVNSSHGCINVGPAYAQWFYDNFNSGDVVDVKGSPVTLSESNGLGDWTVSWDQWLKGSAL